VWVDKPVLTPVARKFAWRAASLLYFARESGLTAFHQASFAQTTSLSFGSIGGTDIWIPRPGRRHLFADLLYAEMA
jgi:hypothetical protein